MKKIAKNILIVALAGLLGACESQKINHEYGGPWFISFEKEGLTAIESASDPVLIAVQLVAPLQTESTTVSFKVNDSGLVEGQDYQVLNTTNELTFAPGEHLQYIRIQLFDNINVEGDKELQMELISSASEFSIGQPGKTTKNKVFTMIVQDDDCPLTMDLFSGKITAVETTPWWGRPTDTGDRDGKFPLTFTPIEELAPGKIKYTVKGLWYCQLEHAGADSWLPDFVEYKEVEMVIDYTNTANPTISWPEQVMAEYSYTGDEEPSFATIQASTNQSVDLSTCGKTLIFRYSMVEEIGWANNFKVTANFNK